MLAVMTKIDHNVVSIIQAKCTSIKNHRTKANLVGAPKSNKEF